MNDNSFYIEKPKHFLIYFVKASIKLMHVYWGALISFGTYTRRIITGLWIFCYILFQESDELNTPHVPHVYTNLLKMLKRSNLIS